MSTRVASRIVGDAEAVSDVLQDAYLNVYRSLERFRGASRYETWVYRIVVNAARSHMRRVRRLRERETSLDQRQEEPLVADVESCPTDRVHERIDVISLLARLSESDRELLTLRYLAGMTIQQVAAELGASEGAVKVRLHRARKRLLALVNEDLAEVQVGTGAPFGEKW
jgi:RNA polymerase sigma-70 factor (ECF subfamily)